MIRLPRQTTRMVVYTVLLLFADAYSKEQDSIVVLNRMRVEASQRGDESISVALEQQKLGVTDDISNLIIAAPGINRIPEAGSLLLVNGSGRYDNSYEVNGVPMFAPSHFSGSRFADRSATLIPTVKFVDINTHSLSGSIRHKTGAHIAIEPGMMQWADINDDLHLALHLGSLHRELYLTVPEIGNHSFQVAYSNAYDVLVGGRKDPKRVVYQLDSLLRPVEVGFDSSLQSVLTYGKPIDFMDLSLTTESRYDNSLLKGHFWLSRDSYEPFDSLMPPYLYWGSGSLTYTVNNGLPIRIIAGGAHQFYHESTLRGSQVLIKEVVRTNGILRAELDYVPVGQIECDGEVLIEGLEWNGHMTAMQRSSEREIESRQAVKEVDGREVNLTVQGGMKKEFGRLGVGADILAAGDYYLKSAWLDPSVWMSSQWANALFHTRAGITTAHPDIRGLPDEYRKELYRTYSVSAGLKSYAGELLFANLEMYGKYSDQAPRFSPDPQKIIWDEKEATPLYAGGINCRLDLSFFDRIYLRTVTDLGISRRRVGVRWQTYEYDIPWSNKSTLHVVAAERKLDLYLTSFFTAGLPYRDVELVFNEAASYGEKIQRMPYYRRIDFKAVFSNDIAGHPFLTRYRGYIGIQNLLSIFEGYSVGSRWYWRNIREYYWDEHGNKMGVRLQDFMLTMGLQVGVRL